MVPACSFALSLPGQRARSAFLLHRLNRLAPIPATSLLHARCAFTGQLTQLLSLSPLPSRSFSLPRDQSVQQALPLSGSSFRIHPISARSPPPYLLLVWASDHRLRFAMSPETRCSSNLLEPTSLCALTHWPVNSFLIVTIRFQQVICACVSSKLQM